MVNLFSPMEKSSPNAENVARTAADLTISVAEERLGVTVDYWTYTAEDYQDKTYDDVAWTGPGTTWTTCICSTLTQFWPWAQRGS